MGRMHQVCVRVHVDASVESVFDAVSDHEAFLRSEELSTKVVRPGQPERNGLGCLREVQVGRRASYVEEITAWQPPSMFEYTIRETSLPLRHAGSRLTFTLRNGGTEVEWTSRFEITVPIIGPLLGLWAKRLYTRSFTALLLAAKTKLEAKAGSLDLQPVR
jgi:hypothetical protein